MKTILYMAVSASGHIAKADGSTPWSDGEWKVFSEMVESCGNIVIGRKTYDIMCQSNDFADMGNPFVIVISHCDLDNKPTNVEWAESPKQALKILQERSFDKVLIGGGGTLNASFLNDGLIDEMYLDMEPFIFAGGINLFVGAAHDMKLKLLDTKKIESDTMQLHYQILK